MDIDDFEFTEEDNAAMCRLNLDGSDECTVCEG